MVSGSGRTAGGAAWVMLAVALATQWQVHRAGPPPQARLAALEQPPSLSAARAAALGEDAALARLLMLRLQSYDVQPGLSLSFRSLDYPRLIAWLTLIVALHPDSQYALLSAARLYAEQPDATRTRLMLAFIHRSFLADPDRRWPWLAHAVVLARHRLNDPELAVFYARELRLHVSATAAPPWVRQMEALALADLGRNEAARVLLGGLLASGTIRDPAERHFLVERLQQLEQDATRAPP